MRTTRCGLLADSPLVPGQPAASSLPPPGVHPLSRDFFTPEITFSDFGVKVLPGVKFSPSGLRGSFLRRFPGVLNGLVRGFLWQGHGGDCWGSPGALSPS